MPSATNRVVRQGTASRSRWLQMSSAAEHECRHHLIADPVVGYGVDRDLADLRQSFQNPLDRRRRQVFAVHPHPVRGAAGKVDPAVGVAVGQVAGPVHAVPHPLGGGGRIVVVAGERSRALGVDQFADRLVEVGQRAVFVELARRRIPSGSSGCRCSPRDRACRSSRAGCRPPGPRSPRTRWIRSCRSPGTRNASRIRRYRDRSPRCRTPPAVSCRRRRDAREWKGSARAACRRSSGTSPGSGARRRGSATARIWPGPSVRRCRWRPPIRRQRRWSETAASPDSRRHRR